MTMVAVGVIWSLLVLVRAFGGQDTERHQDLVSALSFIGMQVLLSIRSFGSAYI